MTIDYEVHEKTMEVKLVAIKGYDWKKGLKKLIWYGAEALIAGVIVIWADDVRFVALIPIAEVIHNWIKHQNLIKL